MLRLAKYIKPYILLLLIAIILLFAQANFDLALPDYLSRIVNVGIQQGGVENAVPVAIRQSEMERLLLFVTDGDRADILKNYTLIEQDMPGFETYVQDYPTAANEPIYVRNEIEDAEIEYLNPIMGKALLAVSTIEQVMADPSMAEQMGGDLDFDVSMIPPGTDIFTVLEQLPPEQLSLMMGSVNQQFEALGDSMVTQAAVSAVKAEYEALGMNLASLQNSYILSVGGIMLLLTLLSGICTVAVGYLSARIASDKEAKRELCEADKEY